MFFRDFLWMSFLVKLFLKKKKIRFWKGGGRDLIELMEKIGWLIVENCWVLVFGNLDCEFGGGKLIDCLCVKINVVLI